MPSVHDLEQLLAQLDGITAHLRNLVTVLRVVVPPVKRTVGWAITAIRRLLLRRRRPRGVEASAVMAAEVRAWRRPCGWRCAPQRRPRGGTPRQR
jgi:hypothetical protein